MAKKFPQFSRSAVIIAILGGIEGLLFAHLMVQLFAIRPDSSLRHVLGLLTAPLLAPLSALNANQPRFGASLDLAALALIIVIPLLLFAVQIAAQFHQKP